MTSEEERQLEEYAAAARREQAPDQLKSQILAHVAYRDQLEQRRSVSQRRSWVAIAALAAAVAAGWLLAKLPQHLPPITAERPDGGAITMAPAASTSRAVVDPCQKRASAAGHSPLLDDFEDGDDAVAPLEGRDGFWRWARETDAPGTAPALIPVPRGDGLPHNRLAIHVKGKQLNDWGATVELDFRPRCYDAVRYAGVSFQARGPGRIYLAAREVDVIPIAEGGTCERDCHNPHIAKVELTDGFRAYQLRWRELRQRGIDRPPLDPSRLHSIAFLVRPEDTPYDVWVDDVSFLPAP
jgi:hypothetical protein